MTQPGPASAADPSSSGSDPLSATAQALACELVRHRTVRVSQNALWQALDAADPTLRASASRRAALASALDELARAGQIALPAAASWDRTARPHLPKFVSLPKTPAAAPAKKTVWRPELAWAASAPLTPAQRDRLAQVNTWLRDTPDDGLTVPARERSLEVFGHEKTLDALLPTGLFAPGRLTLGLLRARRTLPRFQRTVLGSGPVLLVAENHDTYDTLTRALTPDPGRVGTVAWGAGAAFEQSVRSAAELPGITEIRYFGDLDEAGLRIPTSASTTALADRLPPVQPAPGLYALLLQHGTPQPGQRRVPEPEQLASWLPPDQRAATADLLRTGHRLAQETVGLALLTRSPDTWRTGL